VRPLLISKNCPAWRSVARTSGRSVQTANKTPSARASVSDPRSSIFVNPSNMVGLSGGLYTPVRCGAPRLYRGLRLLIHPLCRDSPVPSTTNFIKHKLFCSRFVPLRVKENPASAGFFFLPWVACLSVCPFLRAVLSVPDHGKVAVLVLDIVLVLIVAVEALIKVACAVQ
jgi:hypothetical protein